MKNWKRILLVGFIWGLIFFLWWMASFYRQNWNFKLFSADSWTYLKNEFLGGWVISATSDWIFIIVLILALPVFILGWNLILKVRWRKTVFGFFKQIWYALKRLWYKIWGGPAIIQKKRIKYIKKKSYKRVRPAPLNVTAKAMERQAKQREAMAQSSVATPMSGGLGLGEGADRFVPQTPQTNTTGFSFLDDADLANMSLDDIALPTREPLNEDVTDILIKAGYKVVADATIGDLAVDFVAVDAHKVYVLVSDNENGDWLADEERFNGEDPLWFSESSHRISPIFNMNTHLGMFAERLKNAGSALEVIPVLVVKQGTIINAEDMKETWDKMGIVVCRTLLGGPDELPSVAQAMPTTTEPAEASVLETIRNAF